MHDTHFQGMSDRVLAEQRLRDSEICYRRLFQTAKDGILILNALTGKIIDANVFMSALIGMEPYELLGKDLYEIGMFGEIEENKQAFRELQENGYIHYEYLSVEVRGGERVDVEFIANVYQQDHGLVVQCNVRDIRERVRMQNRIAHQAEALAGESRRKDEFLAMLSHELRNPLVAIRSAVQLLKRQERASENFFQQEACEVIERQVANLTKLVNDLLEVSRVVSGQVRLHLQAVDLNQIIHHALETTRPFIEQRGHELIVSLDSEPIWVSADATRLEEVFVNLLDNAAKFTDRGGRIEVYCEHPLGQNHAQARVRDNGVGIDSEVLPRIFDLFTQADRSLDRSAGGLGIGLNLAQRLLDLQGGTIGAKSPPRGASQGSEFTVQLSLIPAPDELPPNSAQAVEIRQDLERARVLVVEDDVDQVWMLARALRSMGYCVQSAYTGPNGLKVALQWRPDIVLLDIGLPGLNGYDVARRLRNASPDVGIGRITLIALSGYGRDTDIVLAREAGFDAHLIKPYDLDELENVLRASCLN